MVKAGKKTGTVFGSRDVSNLLGMTIGEFLVKYKPPSTHYIIARRGTKLYNVLKAIAIGHPIFIVVVDENRRPIGYITEVDLIKTFSRKPRFSYFIAGFNLTKLSIPIEQALNIPVEKIMEKRPVVVKENEKISDILNIVHGLHVPSIIVVDDKGRIKSVITASFLVRALLRSLLGEPLSIT